MQSLTMMKMMKMTTMVMMLFLYSSHADESLDCHSDFFRTFTCVWNTSKMSISPPIRPETSCSLKINIKKLKRENKAESPMLADPTEPHLRSASVMFQRNLFNFVAMLEHEVHCRNYSNPVARINVRAIDSKVKVSPPQEVKVDEFNVSWTFNNPTIEPDLLFQAQFGSASLNWTNAVTVNVDRPELQLPVHKLNLHHKYVIRVRVKLDFNNAIWSDWSQECEWRSDVGLTTPLPTTLAALPGLEWSSSAARITLTGAAVAIVLIFTLLFQCRSRWKEKNQLLFIPDPSKFFGDLNSQHAGNFMSWLGPTLAHETLIKADTELVSPVEVVKPQDAVDSHGTHRNSAALQDRWEGTNKSSNFSNSTYFLSQSSKGPGGVLEPCSAHSSYGPAGGGSGPQRISDGPEAAQEKDGASELELSLKTLEKLRQDTQSPDSGFAGGCEDSMEETDLPSPLAINLTLPLPRDLHAPLPIMHPFLSFQCTAPLLPPSVMIPGLDFDLKSACGMIEPSSGDYMPVKNVQNEC